MEKTIQKCCHNCQTNFAITEVESDFYDQVSPHFNGKKFQLNTPLLCPACRKQRRYAWRNEFNYYKRQCKKCSKNIISVYSQDSEYTVFCTECYLNRDWDPLTYGRPYNFSRKFFDQFNELLISVPRNAMVNDNGLGSENCEYTFNFVYGKNCYLVTTSWYAENCLYVSKSGRILDVIDCDNVSESELLHECVSSNKLYNCQYLEGSLNCNNCFFGKDLRSCSDCFCCVGLTHKNYCIFNKQYSAEEYHRIISGLKLGELTEIKKIKIKFEQFIETFPKKASTLLNCENSSGDRLANCKNTVGFGIWNAENVRHMDFGDTPKNSQDLLVAGLCQWCYESQVPDHSYQTCFTNYCWSCNEVYYSDDCRYCKNLFGCVGLRQAQYCIFNKQYTKEEYEKLVPKIIESMGIEFGEFFPASISFFDYQETVAQDFTPLKTQPKGFKWKSGQDAIVEPKSLKNIPVLNILEVTPEDISDPFSCITCKKLYKIPQQEVLLRKKFLAALPEECPKCRRLERTKIMNPAKLYERKCDKCNSQITSRYPLEDSPVYCHECYSTYDKFLIS